MAFLVVSLGAKAADGLPSVVHISWTRGLAVVVGTVAAVIVNWILWPFVARHELRKALSAMLIYESIIYRGVVAKYVYYEKGEEPRKEDIERSGKHPSDITHDYVADIGQKCLKDDFGKASYAFAKSW